MTEKRIVVAAVMWTIGVLLFSYLYRIIVIDPRYGPPPINYQTANSTSRHG